MARQLLERLQALDPSATRVVDKAPENYVFLGLIITLFPNAKIIHCRRDLRDTALSCWMACFNSIRWAFDVETIVDRFGQYHRLMDHWRRVLPAQILDVDYEQTVDQTESVVRQIVEFMGLDWDPACLNHDQLERPIHTASKFQARQRVYRSSVGRWHHYRDMLGPLFDRVHAIDEHGDRRQ